MPEASHRPESPNQAGGPETFAEPSAEVERALRRELGALFEGAAAPASVGAALARAAETARSSVRTVPRPWVRAARVGLAAAATLAVVFYALRDRSVLHRQSSRKGAASTATRDFDVADFDASGRVDVWDAYLVLRALESNAELSVALDLDRDGVVTRADADLIAQRAVELVR